MDRFIRFHAQVVLEAVIPIDTDTHVTTEEIESIRDDLIQEGYRAEEEFLEVAGSFKITDASLELGECSRNTSIPQQQGHRIKLYRKGNGRLAVKFTV